MDTDERVKAYNLGWSHGTNGMPSTETIITVMPGWYTAGYVAGRATRERQEEAAAKRADEEKFLNSIPGSIDGFLRKCDAIPPEDAMYRLDDFLRHMVGAQTIDRYSVSLDSRRKVRYEIERKGLHVQGGQ